MVPSKKASALSAITELWLQIATTQQTRSTTLLIILQYIQVRG